MSRSGYSEIDGWELIRWRGAVASAIRGKRGQAFLREMLAALDALPNKRLIAEELEAGGEVCALGSVGKMRSMQMSSLHPEDHVGLSDAFGIPPSLIQEIEFINDDDWAYTHITPEERFNTVRKWVVSQLTNSTGREYGQVTP